MEKSVKDRLLEFLEYKNIGQAGYLCGFADVGYVESLPTIQTIVDHEIKGNYMAFEVRGDSMDNGTKESLEELIFANSINQNKMTMFFFFKCNRECFNACNALN